VNTTDTAERKSSLVCKRFSDFFEIFPF